MVKEAKFHLANRKVSRCPACIQFHKDWKRQMKPSFFGGQIQQRIEEKIYDAFIKQEKKLGRSGLVTIDKCHKPNQKKNQKKKKKKEKKFKKNSVCGLHKHPHAWSALTTGQGLQRSSQFFYVFIIRIVCMR